MQRKRWELPIYFNKLAMLAPSPSDMELVKRLREESPEQFISLVKMHLSFCLDQCTDE